MRVLVAHIIVLFFVLLIFALIKLLLPLGAGSSHDGKKDITAAGVFIIQAFSPPNR